MTIDDLRRKLVAGIDKLLASWMVDKDLKRILRAARICATTDSDWLQRIHDSLDAKP